MSITRTMTLPVRSWFARRAVLTFSMVACACSSPDDGTGGGQGGSTSGGSATTGGATGSGGATVFGGATSGGAQSGGANSGGAISGGASSAGANSGGSSSGGVASGGSSTGGASGAAGAAGSTGKGGSAGTANGGSAGSATGGTAGGVAGAAGAGGIKSSGGAGGTASGGASTGGTSTGGTATGGTSTGGAVSCTSVASTGTRPQLTASQAAMYTALNYLAKAGTTSSLNTDNWNPTAGLGSAASLTADFTVAKDGSGTHSTVQAAINAATGSTRRNILIKPNTYPETISIPSGAAPITLYGADTDATKVVIVAGKSANDAGGTGQSATFTSKAAGLQLMNLTISNDFATPASGTNIQAVALYTTGDKTVLQNVRLHGFQDTAYFDSSSATTVARVYVKNGFIEGDTDFIFGRATVVFDGTEIHYLSSRKGTGSGVHFAPSTHVDNPLGFLAIGCKFTADGSAPASKISLGRSWDQSSTTPTPNGQAIVRESALGAHINKTAPWAAAATSGRAYSATGNRFNEYCNSGPGSGG